MSSVGRLGALMSRFLSKFGGSGGKVDTVDVPIPPQMPSYTENGILFSSEKPLDFSSSIRVVPYIVKNVEDLGSGVLSEINLFPAQTVAVGEGVILKPRIIQKSRAVTEYEKIPIGSEDTLPNEGNQLVGVLSNEVVYPISKNGENYNFILSEGEWVAPEETGTLLSPGTAYLSVPIKKYLKIAPKKVWLLNSNNNTATVGIDSNTKWHIN